MDNKGRTMTLQELWDALDQLAIDTSCPEGLRAKCGSWCCSPSKASHHIPVMPRERDAILDHLKKKPPPPRIDACMFLSPEGECSVHPVRPIACRAFTCADDENGERKRAIDDLMARYFGANPDELDSSDDMRRAFKPPNPREAYYQKTKLGG